MKIKKIFLFVLVTIFIFSMAACMLDKPLDSGIYRWFAKGEAYIADLMEKNIYTNENEDLIFEKYFEYQNTLCLEKKEKKYESIFESFKQTIDSIKPLNVVIEYESHSIEEFYELGIIAKSDLMDAIRENYPSFPFCMHGYEHMSYYNEKSCFSKLIYDSYRRENNLPEDKEIKGKIYGRYNEYVIASIYPSGTKLEKTDIVIQDIHFIEDARYFKIWKPTRIIDSTKPIITGFYLLEEAKNKEIISEDTYRILKDSSTSLSWRYTNEEELQNMIYEAFSDINKGNIFDVKYYGIFNNCLYFKVSVSETEVKEIIATFY